MPIPISSSRASARRSRRASARSKRRRIELRIADLDDATKEFAGRRMNRAIAKAIEGHKVDVVEQTVETAKGVEEAHAWRS